MSLLCRIVCLYFDKCYLCSSFSIILQNNRIDDYSQLVFVSLFHHKFASLNTMKTVKSFSEKIFVNCVPDCYNRRMLLVFYQGCCWKV